MLKLIVLLCLFGVTSYSAADQISLGDQRPVPDLRWSDGNDIEHRLSENTTMPKLVHFWASWCIPCREEMPLLLQWQKSNPEIQVLILSLDQKMAQTKHFIKKFRLDMAPLLLNEDDVDALAIPVVPYSIFVSADNRLLASYAGIAAWSDQAFTDEVRRLLLNKSATETETVVMP